jgi:succinyl-CoA synthetase beta subunit
MNLHEYQAKELFGSYGMPVPNGQVIAKAEEAGEAIGKLSGSRWIVKAQVHAGGRGKAGGVKLVDSAAEAKTVAETLLGTRLVTFQTDARGQPINSVLIEETCDIDRELYLGAVIDRAQRRVVVMASTEGGMEIEKVAQESPEKILKTSIDPMLGAMPFQSREIGFGLGLSGGQLKQFGALLSGLARLFVDKDLSLVEINPLVVTKEGNLLCIDGKINVDENALFRHGDLAKLHDKSQEDERELEAKEWDLSYISLDGNIGCMVNGAGLAMATMDLIKLQGGDPANFLDVGGTATKERVAEAFKIILSDDKVKGILVNIFGGIVRCDLIAEGIVAAAAEAHIQVPVVVRLEGNNAERGSEILRQSGLNLTPAEGLTDAAEKIVAAVGEAK